MGLLERVRSPRDLGGFSYGELYELAREIRELILRTVSVNGGHLASNLGVVELTIALHRVFESPRDRIIWDVGHQCYVHKILTGRWRDFHTLRQYGGISGFPEPSESEHDHFVSGHASNSLSFSLGVACGRDFSGDDFDVVVVIGDGSLTGGMAYEALNNIGHLKKRLIIVLNDNGMAISPSVGALSRILSRVRLDLRYRRFKKRLFGLPFARLLSPFYKKFVGGMKGFILESPLWEELGFTYIGPIDGHDIKELEEYFRMAKAYKERPLLLHVVTKKGKGYSPAEERASDFHGVSSPSLSSGLTYSEVLGRTLIELFEEDPRLVGITAAMLEGTGLKPLKERFPERVFDVGICEQHAVSFAAGLASQGFIPIVCIYSTFLQRAFDQVIEDVCLHSLPVVFCIDRAGIVGEDGKSHHGIFDLSYLGLVPNLIVSAPKDGDELRNLVRTAINSKKPFAIRYPRGRTEVSFKGMEEVPIGRGEILKDGVDGVIVGIGDVIKECLKASELLEDMGISPAVINARFLKPLDRELILNYGKRTGFVLTVEENVLDGGFGSHILRLFEGEDVKVSCHGLPSAFIEHGPRSLLKEIYGLTPEAIVRSFMSLRSGVR